MLLPYASGSLFFSLATYSPRLFALFALRPLRSLPEGADPSVAITDATTLVSPALVYPCVDPSVANWCAALSSELDERYMRA